MTHISLYHYKITVERVVDGDTLFVDIDLGFNIHVKEFVRLINVDTPEVYGKYSSPEGKLATLYTELWLRGREAEFDYYKDNNVQFTSPYLSNLYLISEKYDHREKYGRSLGRILRGHDVQEDLGEALLAKGLIK